MTRDSKRALEGYRERKRMKKLADEKRVSEGKSVTPTSMLLMVGLPLVGTLFT